MAIRTISYSVKSDGISPKTEQQAGLQSEHAVTQLVFTLDSTLYQALLDEKQDGDTLVYRFDCIDSTGGTVRTEPTELTNSVITFTVRENLTRNGGKARVYLIISRYNSKGKTETELLSFPAKLRFENVPETDGDNGNSRESLSILEEAAKNSAKRSKQSAEAAKQSADIAEKLIDKVKGDISELQNGGYVADAQRISEKINSWLDEHPEATTTVQDKSIDLVKFNDNAKKYIVKDYVTPEMFGAVGDGAADDTAALQAAFAIGTDVLLNGVYAVSAEIKSNCKSVTGRGGIKLLNDVDRIFTLDCIEVFSGIYFDCNSKGVTHCIYTTAANPIIKDVTIENISDSRADKGSCGIECLNAYNVLIENITVKNCRHIYNGTIGDWGGNISGIYVKDYSEKCTIRSCRIENIHNIDSNGNIVFEDTSGVYIATDIQTASAYISDIRGIEYGKRLIKTQVFNAVIDGVYSYNSNLDHLCTIGVLGGWDEDSVADKIKVTISNCMLINDRENSTASDYLIAFSSATGIISNCVFQSKSQFCIYTDNDSKVEVNNCKINGNGFIGISSQIHFYNCAFSSKNLTYNRIPMQSIKFVNCVINEDTTEDTMEIYTFFFHIQGDEVIFDNCKIMSESTPDFVQGVFRFRNTDYTLNGAAYAIIKEGAVADFTDCTFTKNTGNIMWVHGTCKLSRTRFVGDYTFAIAVSDTNTAVIDFGDTELNDRFYIKTTSNFTNKAVMLQAIPDANRFPVGTKFIYEEDGCLYVKDSTGWVKQWS